MSWYDDWLLPRLCHLAMRNRRLAAYRRRLIPEAEGRILEIGIGSGLNLPLYTRRVGEIVGVEPSAALAAMADDKARNASVRVKILHGSAEAIPLDRASFDTAVTTWTLCTIPDAVRALDEVRRVLKPGGRLLFVEHGASPDPGVAKWQNRLTPVWRHISGGCHLNRPIVPLIEGAGFRIDRLATGYMPGPKPMTYMYEGSARPT